MDVLTECRFLLNLVAYAKTLVTGFGTTAPGQPTVTVRGVITTTTNYTVTDEGFIRILFKRIYNEPFPYETFPAPGATGIDERVADLINALAAVPRG